MAAALQASDGPRLKILEIFSISDVSAFLHVFARFWAFWGAGWPVARLLLTPRCLTTRDGYVMVYILKKGILDDMY